MQEGDPGWIPGVAISFYNAWKWKVQVKSLSHVRPLATPWTAAYQAPPSMGVSKQEYWSGVPLPSPRKIYSYNLFFSISSHVYELFIEFNIIESTLCVCVNCSVVSDFLQLQGL